MSFEGFRLAIKEQRPVITTTQTHAISSYYYEMGYEIILSYKNQCLYFSKLLNGEYKDYVRHLRLAHNWEKMFYAGEFHIPGVFEYEV